MAHPSIPKTQFLLIVCLLSSSLAFATSAATTATGSTPGLPGVISGGYYLQPYSAALQSSFGTPPYTYTLVGGALPPGITMNSAGKIAGTPSDTGAFNFQVKATDSSRPPVSKTSSYSWSISIGFDTYGGLTAAPAAKVATGYFHMQKQSGRWKLVSPMGNNFYLLSVFNANESFIESGIMQQRYNNDGELGVLYNAKPTNGDHPILGIDFWSLTDSGRGESTNWGLMSDRDNAYDGKAAIVAPGTDQWGFPTGGEDRSYGNFLGEVTQTNLNTVKQFIVETR